MSEAPRTGPFFAPGAVITPTYAIERFLGSGAYGEVYCVRHKYLGRQAMKIFPPGGLEPTRDFFQEARILLEVTDPNIVRVFDANVLETAGQELPFMVMEYIEGETLGSLLRRTVRLSIDEALGLAHDMCRGLSAAHTLEPPLLHLDLTLGNVLVTTVRGRRAAKIADFGVAAHVHPKTRMARAQGEYFFMAPEMFWGYATTASDVYSLAFLLYWVLAGVPPFPRPDLPEGASRDTLVNAIRATRNTEPPPLERFRHEVPAALAKIVAKALSLEPESRFSDAAEFWRAVQDVSARLR
jgi:serine/threonine-protein kinase